MPPGILSTLALAGQRKSAHMRHEFRLFIVDDAMWHFGYFGEELE
jgi:hypothetical protein